MRPRPRRECFSGFPLSPPWMFSFIIPSGLFECQSNKGRKTHVRDSRGRLRSGNLHRLSSSAKADDPVLRDGSVLTHRPGILDARWSLSSGGHSADPLAGMTAVV